MGECSKSTESLIRQLDDQMQFKHPLHELLSLDKKLSSIQGSWLEECIEREKRKLTEIENNPEHDDGIQEDIRNRINMLKGRLINLIMGIKETITKVLNRESSLAKKI